LFCINDLRRTMFDKVSFLEAANDVICDLANSSSAEITIKKIQREMKKLPEDKRIKIGANKASHCQTLFQVLYLATPIARRLDELLSCEHYYHKAGAHGAEHEILDAIRHGEEREIEKMSLIEMSMPLLKNQRVFEERLAKAGDKIYHNAKEIYTFYIKMLEGYDFSKLSPLMKEHYDILLSEPSEEDWIGRRT